MSEAKVSDCKFNLTTWGILVLFWYEHMFQFLPCLNAEKQAKEERWEKKGKEK